MFTAIFHQIYTLPTGGWHVLRADSGLRLLHHCLCSIEQERPFVHCCVFRESWAPISRDLGHAFHAIVGSHFADTGMLADGFMESGLIGSVKRFRDVGPASEAFS